MALADAFRVRGPLSRGRYAVLGAGLALAKVNVDRLLASVHGRYWDPIHYWIPGERLGELSRADLPLYASLAAVAVPFVWTGVLLTLRRLRDAGLPVWLVALFFVPFVNLLLFLALCVAPTQGAADRSGPYSGPLERLVPRGKWASAAAGLGLAAVLSVLLTLLGTVVLGTYGWGLFVGIPFLSGLLSALLYGYRGPRSVRSSVGVAVTSVWLASLLLIGLAIEGAICIVMAAPLAGAVAALGGLVGYGLQRHGPRPRAAGGVCSVAILALPLLLGVETVSAREPAVTPVRTSVIVAAPPQVVWRHVVSFSELPPPQGLLFRSGVAYPTSAHIEGEGVGAIRRCRFSTGDFVEPITRWEEPRLLAFSVASQPAPMRELSPWGSIHPPHLDGFLLSRRGEFRLRALPGGRTLLEGTTWYENRMWPAAYWRLWSDELIHRIHRRVLEHVAREAERDVRLPD